MKHFLPLIFAALSTSLFAQVQFYGPVAPSAGGVTAQDFESTYDIYDAQGADDFVVPTGVTWYIDSIVIPGSYSANAAATCGLIYNIHNDNSGEPGTIVTGDTINSDLDGNGDGDLTLTFETPLQVNSGHYWLVANGRKNFANGGGQWYWQRDSAMTGYPALWRNPGNGFSTGCTSWTTFYNCTGLTNINDSGLTFYIYGCYGPTKPIGTGFDTLLCAGAFNNVTLVGDTNGSQTNVTYQWSTGATTQSITVSSSGTYTLYAEDSVTLCGRTASYTVGIGSVPEPNIEDDTICGASSIPSTFGPVGGCPNCVTQWSDGSTGSFFSTFDEGWVVVTVLDTSSGCTSSDSAYVTVISADVNIEPGDLIDLCEGTTVTVSVQETLTSYSWAFSTDGSNWNGIGSNSTAEVTQGGLVAVSGINSEGCEVFDTSNVVLRPEPDPTISFTSLSNGNVELEVDGDFDTYLWDDGSVGQVITVSSNGLYTVTVTDEFGCEGTAFINVFTVGAADAIVSQLEIYPNPANEQLTIAWPQEWVGVSTATIYDLQGRTLMTINSSEQLQSVSLDQLAAGNYVLQVKSPQGVGNTSIVITR